MLFLQGIYTVYETSSGWLNENGNRSFMEERI